jgi:hypothetical protein
MIRNKPPPDEPFIWLTRELLSSDAWRSQNIHTRRFIDFLLLEHMRHGGQNNGQLKAPQRQLYAFRIWERDAVPAIVLAEELGLVACIRGVMRAATTYRLTWLESHDGRPATNEWRAYRNPDLPPLPAPKIRNLPVKCQAGLPVRCQADAPNLPGKRQADAAQKPACQMPGALKRTLPPRKEVRRKQGVAGADAPASAPACVVVTLRRSHGPRLDTRRNRSWLTSHGQESPDEAWEKSAGTLRAPGSETGGWDRRTRRAPAGQRQALAPD